MKLDGLRANLAAKYLLMAALPLIVLIYTPVSNAAVLLFGDSILLKTLPVDPRDILRGDYVNLEYEISIIPKDLLPEGLGKDGYGYGIKWEDIYVSLEKDKDGIAKVSKVSAVRPPGGLYLKARLLPGWSAPRFDYNLGVYYIPEGTGRALEDAIRDAHVLADVRVFRGRAVIRKLEVTPGL